VRIDEDGRVHKKIQKLDLKKIKIKIKIELVKVPAMMKLSGNQIWSNRYNWRNYLGLEALSIDCSRPIKKKLKKVVSHT